MSRTKIKLPQDKLLALHGAGCTLQEMALVFKVSFQIVRARLVELGLSTRTSIDPLALKQGIEEGLNYTQLGDRIGVCYLTLKRHMKKHGLVLPPSPRGRKKHISDKDIHIKKLREEGLTLQAIGDIVGMTREGVRLSLLKHNTETPK